MYNFFQKLRYHFTIIYIYFYTKFRFFQLVSFMVKDNVMVVGAGEVGRFAVEYLAHYPIVRELIIVDINEMRGKMVAYNAEIAAAIHKYYPRIVYEKLDIADTEKVVDVLRKYKPKVILHVATLLSSFYYQRLAKAYIKAYKLPYKSHLAGHTFAKDFYLIYKLMQAVKQSDIDIRVVNLSFPDNTHIALGKLGLAPTIGAGTIDLTVHGIKKHVSETLNIEKHNVNVVMVAHHAIRTQDAKYVPFYLKIEKINGEDLTNKFDAVEVVNKGTYYTGVWGGGNSPMTAASAVDNVIALLSDSGVIKHAPGPAGLPGGWPVEITWDEVKVVLPPEVSMEKAMEMNIEGMKLDGIERVENDGTVVFTKETVEYMATALDMHWTKVKPDETLDMSKELIEAYHKLEEKLRKEGIIK